MRSLPFVIISCCVLVACDSATLEFDPPRISDVAHPQVQALLANPAELKAFLADTTIKTWDPLHGTQVEYLSANGQTWLVYPGNTRAVRGEWQIRSDTHQPELCYRYGPNSYNPVTRQRGSRWSCSPAILTLAWRYGQMVDGDVLGVRQIGIFPQPMPPDVNISLNTIMVEIGRGPLQQADKMEWRRER